MAQQQHKPGLESAGNNDAGYHIPVLYAETIDALQVKPEGVYVDCTFGGGGHSKGILLQLASTGRLIAFDQDADAQANLPKDDRVLFVAANFRHIQRFLRLNGITQVDGLLADLGVSSHQFDVGERGFSTRFNGPLDMRMDQRQELTASKLLKSYGENQLHKLFELYGEVTNAKTLARHIVENRQRVPLQTIDQLKSLLAPVVKGNPNKYLAQVFQALRIEVNDEMGALKEMLLQLPSLIKPGGRAAIITFHSVEDRLVKNFFRQGHFDDVEQEDPFQQQTKKTDWKLITKKPITAAATETKTNPRSRSAKLRVAEKI